MKTKKKLLGEGILRPFFAEIILLKTKQKPSSCQLSISLQILIRSRFFTSKSSKEKRIEFSYLFKLFLKTPVLLGWKILLGVGHRGATLLGRGGGGLAWGPGRGNGGKCGVWGHGQAQNGGRCEGNSSMASEASQKVLRIGEKVCSLSMFVKGF